MSFSTDDKLGRISWVTEMELEPGSHEDAAHVQRGPKVTSLVARSSRGRCVQHLHDVCPRFTPDSHRMRASHPRIRRKCCAHLPRTTRDVTV
jgi:hypothetical protein